MSTFIVCRQQELLPTTEGLDLQVVRHSNVKFIQNRSAVTKLTMKPYIQYTRSVQVYRKGFVFVQQRKISHFSFCNPHFSFGNYHLLVFIICGLG